MSENFTSPQAAKRSPVSITGTAISVVILLLGFLGATVYRHNAGANAGLTVPIEKLPFDLNGWHGETTSNLESKSREILRLDSYVRRLYSKGAENVFLYIGYWSQQTGDSQAAKHTPSLCLPANGWKIDRLGEKPLELPFAKGRSTLLVNRIAGEIAHERYLIYYWFANGNEYYPQEWQSLARISWNALMRRRTDGGILEISARIDPGPGGEEKAAKVLNDFLSDFQPQIDALITAPLITPSRSLK